MKRVIKLTESDLTTIVKRVIYESESYDIELYLRRRGVNMFNTLMEVVESMNVCKYIKLTTFFDHVFYRLIEKLYLTNEFLRRDFESPNADHLETEIRNYVINDKLDTLIYYYSLKCYRKPKY